jgi:hypothetical protein
MPNKLDASLLSDLLISAGLSREAALATAMAKMEQEVWVGGKRVVKQKLPKLRKSAGTTVHTVKVNLYGAKPPIWRRLEIPSAMSLRRVHEVLQVTFGWDGYHLHEFQTVCGEFGDPDHEDEWSERADENAVALAQVAAEEKAKVVYVYDFGDDWRHDIVVEKITRAVPGVAYPRCTAGRGFPPEEDSGGIWIDDTVEPGPSEPFSAPEVTEALTDLAEVIVPAS